MKIDRSKTKKSSTEVPAECKVVIDRLKKCKSAKELSEVLSEVQTWTYGKCELYHWIDVLDLFDSILSKATERADSGWTMTCEKNNSEAEELKKCVRDILNFTTLLIEHSFSRHLYNSMEHLTALLAAADLTLVLDVLHLLYMFSKRSNFLTRLPEEKREMLIQRLSLNAETWGGKESGLGLAACCQLNEISHFPQTVTSAHLEYQEDGKPIVIHVDNVHLMGQSVNELMKNLVSEYNIPSKEQMILFTHLRLAHYFPYWTERLRLVQARLQSLSILVYANTIQDSMQHLLYNGLIEELVDILELDEFYLTDIKAAALRTLTSIIHLDRTQNFPNIIDSTGASLYHGFLPMMVRNCINSLTSPSKGTQSDFEEDKQFPMPLATSLFSFLYHLASYELGGEALVNCGMLESLLKVVNWKTADVEHITFVTRAVRVIDLITNIDMQAFQTHSGLSAFVNRLEAEILECRAEQPFELIPSTSKVITWEDYDGDASMDTLVLDDLMDSQDTADSSKAPSTSKLTDGRSTNQCLPQRAALLKSMLNFLKKVIQDAAFSDNIRHIMEGSLPSSLKHIISNAEYYGASLFLLATDAVAVYVFQEPSLLSALQDTGLTDAIFEALLNKDVPATKEVISTIPNVFSALCLNSRGLHTLNCCKPFKKLFKMLISPEYLPAMRRRRAAEPMGDTPCNFGGAMDELMRHQPTLKGPVTESIVELLQEICRMGSDFKVSISRSPTKHVVSSVVQQSRGNTNASEGGSSDEDDEEDDEASTASQIQAQAREDSNQSNASGTVNPPPATEDKAPVPLVDYILNTMKFLDSILSNNSTDDHCKEFVSKEGLQPLLKILCLPNLPIDFPGSPACLSVSTVCKSILNLAREDKVLKKSLESLDCILDQLEVLNSTLKEPGSSILLHELATSSNPAEACSNPSETPILHAMTAAHALVMMLTHVCRTGQTDIRVMSISNWGSNCGLRVLKKLSKLYLNLVWESTILLALCSGEYKPKPGQFAMADLERIPPVELNFEVSFKGLDNANENDSGNPTNEGEFWNRAGVSLDPQTCSNANMDMELCCSSHNSTVLVHSSTQTNSPKACATLQYYAKIIKPILSASSRLGRALAELFGLLVKLCVGSPLRQRRNHLPSSTAYVTPAATRVASELAQLLYSGLQWEPKPNSPVFRLTFSICAVGFSAPLLFDEKKFPYHLMLKYFSVNGLDALFDVFYWAMSPSKVAALEGSSGGSDNLARPEEHQIEFLDSWLNLVEKFVNPKAVLESPHLIGKPERGSTPVEFNTQWFIAHVHKKAFEAVMYLWKDYDMRWLGARTVESMLAILCHILRYKGHTSAPKSTVSSAPREKMQIDSSEAAPAVSVEVTSAATGSSSSSTSAPVARPPWSTLLNPAGRDHERFPSDPPTDSSEERLIMRRATSEETRDPSLVNLARGTRLSVMSGHSNLNNRDQSLTLQASETYGVDPNQLDQLMDMGFSFDRCVDALVATNSIVQAAEYMLSTADNSNPPVSYTPAPGSNKLANGAVKGSSETKNEALQSSKTSESLRSEDIEVFTASVLDQCLGLLDKIPESVFRVRELIVTVGVRKGDVWMKESLEIILDQALAIMAELTEKLDMTQGPLFNPVFFSKSAPLALRLHLFTLIFEDLKGACAALLEIRNAIELSVNLLLSYHRAITNSSDKQRRTPAWVAPLILLLDLYEKAAIAARRKMTLFNETDDTWRWFDINSGKWCAYSPQNNSTINKAFWDGQSSVRINAGRRRYIINFNAMIQLNEDTSNRRPITLWLKNSKEKEGKQSQAAPSTDNSSTPSGFPILRRLRMVSSDGEPEEELFRCLSQGAKASAPNALDLFQTPEESKKCHGLSEDEKMRVVESILKLDGLGNHAKNIIRCCVTFISVPVDPDTLHAILRLVLRLTRDYSVAGLFCEFNGVQRLMELKTDSGFHGYVGIITLILRHMIEDPSCLRYAIEKMMRSKALTTGASTCKELHYLLRVLAPIACRSPKLFVDVAKDLFRVDLPFVTRRSEEDLRLIVKPVPCKAENMKTSMGEPAHSVIRYLLLTLALHNFDEDDKEKDSHINCTGHTGSSDRKHVDSHFTETAETNTSEAEIGSENEKSKGKSSSCKNAKKGMLLPMQNILQILSDSVHSYSYACKIIAEFTYSEPVGSYVTQDSTALSLLIDHYLPTSHLGGDKDFSLAVKTLLSSMAGCNHLPEAQSLVIAEVKAAIHRALALPECKTKHHRLQSIAVLICTMIESCPTSPPNQMVAVIKATQIGMNPIVRLLIRRNVITDLARVSHHLDLNSPHMAATVNAILKPIEVISRIVNQPVPGSANKSRPKSESTNVDSANNTNTGATSNSEMTHAQGEETVEDADNTEHDISTAGESLLDATSESHTHEHETGADQSNHDDDGLDDLMEQYLERENNQQDDPMISDGMIIDNPSARIETERNQTQRNTEDFNADQFEEDHQDDTTDSDSDDTDADEEADEEGNANDMNEDEDDDDDDEEDEEEAVSNFDDRENEFMDEGFMRIGGVDRDDDLLMIQYGQEHDNIPVFLTNNPSYNLGFGVFDEPMPDQSTMVGNGTISAVHPLLTPPSNEPQGGPVASRPHRTRGQRRYQYIQLNTRHPHPPAILQRLLGPSTAQEVMQLTTGQALTQGLRDARLFVMDTTSDRGLTRGGPDGRPNSLSSYTAMHWWIEEAKLLDGESMYDCVVGIKREIVETVEYHRDKALQARNSKKSREEEGTGREKEPKRVSDMFSSNDLYNTIRSTFDLVQSDDIPEEIREIAFRHSDPRRNTSNRPADVESSDMELEGDPITPLADDPTRTINSEGNTNQLEAVNLNVEDMEIVADNEDDVQILPPSSNPNPNADSSNPLPPEEPQVPEAPMEDGSTNEPNVEQPVESCQVSSNEPSTQVQASSSNSADEPVPGPSGTQVDDFRNILGDIDIPEGIDPSFLAALPEELRQEVITEHLRTLQRQSNAQQSTSTNTSDATAVPVTEVSQEFLAALPPSIQEEVLAQQRSEHQRVQASQSNPNEPVDPEEFFRNLQPALRQAIFQDMEESQLASLPPDLMIEATNSRRDYESRHRFISNSQLSSILRNTGIRNGPPRYGLHNITHRQTWSNWTRPNMNLATQSTFSNTKIKGKQLLDHETLCCLLVLLFIDDPRLNTGRLHRVLRNLCYHSTTRQWVVRALLSVMERANDCTSGNYAFVPKDQTGPSSTFPFKDNFAVPSLRKGDKKPTTQIPNWLNMTLDAALGCKSNVFQIVKTPSSGKKSSTEHKKIIIHSQAVPNICRHVLDILSNLAKSFPSQFLPNKGKPQLLCLESSSKVCNLVERRPPTPPVEIRTRSSYSSKSKDEFWDLLVRLDLSLSGKKCKGTTKSTGSEKSSDSTGYIIPFESSPFGQLIAMLSYAFVRKSTALTDRLLRLLSLISLGIPDASGYGRKVILEEPDVPLDPTYLISESHLRLIVDIITSKNCSEEGLEEATSLLLNLSYGPPHTRDRILGFLIDGVKDLGNVVCANIGALLRELRPANKSNTNADLSLFSRESQDLDSMKFLPNISRVLEPEIPERSFKGVLTDRFTRETIVVSSSSKNRGVTGSSELQLPAMSALTSKTSSQAFFLRLLKVIISLREAIRVAIKTYKQGNEISQIGTPRMSSTIIASNSDTQPGSSRAVESNNRGRNASAMDIESSGTAPQSIRNLPIVRISLNDCLNDLGTSSNSVNQPSTSAVSNSVSPILEGSSKHKGSKKDKDAVPMESSGENREHQFDEGVLLPRLSSLLDLNELWDTLSKCLQELEHTPDHHAVLVLQPAVEAFFLVHAASCDKDDKKSNVRESREAQLAHLQQELPPVSPISSKNEMKSNLFDTQGANFFDTASGSSVVSMTVDTQKFLKFAETHRTVLNQILRQSTMHLADGPFSVLVDHTRVLDFDVKRRYFRTELERMDEGVRREDLAVHVRRSHVFEDSFRELHRRSSEEWKNRFYIVFEGEEGQDAGGLLREWYVIISREIFNPNYVLFTISPGDRVTYMINPSSHFNNNHLLYFKFVGRVIAKAIYDNKLLECYFTRSFYKHILGKHVRHSDMESEDYSFYQGLAFLMDNNVSELGYDLTFSTEVQEFGKTEIRDLIPNGRNIPVTEENKMEYVRLVCQMKMTGAIRKQLNAFLEGFYDIIPKRLISIFNEQELELLVSGLPNIDIDDLKSNTEYHKYQASSLQIQWFWRALRSFDQADRAKFLQFVTGTSKVPLQGFSALEGMNGVQKFQIHRDDRSTDRLPSAHTCFNQLDLPAYETYDKLRTYLFKAIHECCEGFGFA